MASTYYNSEGKEVFDGDVALASDLNTINTAIDTGFQLVETAIDVISANQTFYTDLAQKWAENPEDTPVTVAPDKFSALHWAAKAEDDATQTAADRVQTGLDRVDTTADAAQTAADRVQTGLDATATAADRVQTGLDAAATEADRIQTGLDAAATAADRTAIENAFPTITANDKSKILVVQNDLSLAYEFPIQSRKNYFINGGPTIFQHGTVLSTPGYNGGADRWGIDFVGASGNASGLYIDNPAVYSQTRLLINRVGGTLATHYFYFYQKIEGVRSLNGKKATVSFIGYSSIAGKKVAVEIVQRFGTGGSGPISVGTQVLTLTNSHAPYSLTFDIPAIAVGKTYGEDNNLEVNFWIDAGANFASRAGNIGLQGTTQFVFSEFQFEEGPAATDFEVRSVQEELTDCMRYSEKFSGILVNELSYRMFPFKVKKRAVPTISNFVISGGGDGTITVDAGITDFARQVNPTGVGASWFTAFAVSEL